MNKGLFITFEGIDGSGKSTQLKRLTEWLVEKKLPFRVLREPGGTELGEAIRKLLLEPNLKSMSAEAELLLFFAARAELVRAVIRPALNNGELVICDRFYDSTLAYQGYGRALGAEKMDGLLQWAVGKTKPDLTVLVDLPADVALQRQRGRDLGAADRIEAEGRAFMDKVRAGYLVLAAAEPQRFLVLDGVLPEEEIFDELICAIKQRLSDHFGV